MTVTVTVNRHMYSYRGGGLQFMKREVVLSAIAASSSKFGFIVNHSPSYPVVLKT